MSVSEAGATASDAMTTSTGMPPDTPVSQATTSHHFHPMNPETPSQYARSPPLSQMQQTSQQQQQQQQARSVKRPRPVKSCTECRKRKLKCDRLLPCSQCQKSSRVCKYAAEHESSNLSDASENEAPEPGRSIKRQCVPGSVNIHGSGPADPSFTPASKNGEQPGMQLLEDLSVRMERLEKQVLVRSPAVTDPYAMRLSVAPTHTIRGLTVKRGMLKTRYFGQNSPRLLMNLFEEARSFNHNQHNISGAQEVLAGFHRLHKSLHNSYKEALAPIGVYVDSMMPIFKRMTDVLPPKQVCDRLLANYMETSELLYRVLHLPSFSEQYNLYWEGKVQYESFVPQLLSVLAIASRFDTKSKGFGHERSEGIHIPTACALVRSYLDSLKGKQLIDLTTLQVEILLLHAQRMITPRAEDGWTQLGQVIRLAMTMGLHRDPSEVDSRMSVFIGELRRRLWYTLVDMDLHISLNCNMPCIVREGDSTCQPPRNLDDADLIPGLTELPPSKPIDQTTDCQTQVYAATTMPVRLRVAQLVHRIDTVRDYQEVLDLGSKLDRFLEDINYIFPRHGPLSDTQKSRVWRTRVLLDMHVRRPLLALYRPFAIGAGADVPAQISRTYLRSSMIILKYLDEIDPLLAHYQELKDMYHLVLKRDIVQAAFSVCYYVRLAVRASPAHAGGSAGPAYGLSPEPLDDYASYPMDNLILWPPARLIATVEKTLDLLLRNASGSDMKDIVSLATALESVRSAIVREDDILNGLRATLDKCHRSTDMMMLEKVIPLPPQGQPPTDQFQMDRYGMSRLPSMYPGNSLAGMGSFDLDGWNMWDGWV